MKYSCTSDVFLIPLCDKFYVLYHVCYNFCAFIISFYLCCLYVLFQGSCVLCSSIYYLVLGSYLSVSYCVLACKAKIFLCYVMCLPIPFGVPWSFLALKRTCTAGQVAHCGRECILKYSEVQTFFLFCSGFGLRRSWQCFFPAMYMATFFLWHLFRWQSHAYSSMTLTLASRGSSETLLSCRLLHQRLLVMLHLLVHAPLSGRHYSASLL